VVVAQSKLAFYFFMLSKCDFTNFNFSLHRSFDFEIELKSGIVHAFVSILKEEYSKLYEFINSKGIRIKSNNEKIVRIPP